MKLLGSLFIGGSLFFALMSAGNDCSPFWASVAAFWLFAGVFIKDA